MNKVLISNDYPKRFKYKRLFKKALDQTLLLTKTEGISEANVLITTQEEMHKLCLQYKKKDSATDVLSFPADWKELSKLIGYNILGDIVISYEHVIKQSNEYGHSLKREWTYLFVHGLLHLIGYDHIEKADEEIMNTLANEIMSKIGVGR